MSLWPEPISFSIHSLFKDGEPEEQEEVPEDHTQALALEFL